MEGKIMLFRSLRLFSAAILLSGASVAFAADLPTSKPVPAPIFAAPFNWTGFYLGLNAGGVWNGDNTAVIGSTGFVGLGPTIVPSSLSTSSAGFIGGGQIGYNYQLNTIVLGLEADIDGASTSKSTSFTGATVLGTTLTTSASSRLDYLGTVRGRLGFTVTPMFLIYATGGLAYGGGSQSGSVLANGTGLAWNGSGDSTRVGWTIGGGAEYALTQNISLKAEYLYYDLGRKTVASPGNAAVVAVPALDGIYLVSRSGYAGSIGRVGVNYKF
jgi:outer membrane immunogenic protein